MERNIESLAPGTPIQMPPVGPNARVFDPTASVWLATGAKVPEAVLASPSYNNGSRMAMYGYDPATGKVYTLDIAKTQPVEVLEGKKAEAFLKAATSRVKKHQDELRSLICAMRSGSDPEVWVVNRNDEVIPSYQFLTKKTGLDVQYPDGFQAEFNHSSRSCHQQMASCIRHGLHEILAAARAKFDDARLSLETVREIPMELRMNAPEEWCRLGCAPSFNAYGEPQLDPGDPKQLRHRSLGGHMHFGPEVTPQVKATINWPNIVKALDKTAGLVAVSMAEPFDNPLRRNVDGKGHGYGRAGEHRLPAHGLEYRVPSAFWLCAPPIFHLYWDFSRSAFRMAMSGFSHLLEMDEQEVREVINNTDAEAARKLIVANKSMFDMLLHVTYSGSPYGNKGDQIKAAWEAITHGVQDTIADPTDVERNWAMDTYGKNSYTSDSDRYNRNDTYIREWWQAARSLCSNHKPIKY